MTFLHCAEPTNPSLEITRRTAMRHKVKRLLRLTNEALPLAVLCVLAVAALWPDRSQRTSPGVDFTATATIGKGQR
jgi:hypothetical protein